MVAHSLGQKKGGYKEKIVIDELLTRQVASLLASGSNANDIAKTLNISYALARRVIAMPETKSFMTQVGEAALLAAKTTIRKRIASLSDKILEVIEKQLDEGNLEAVKVALKVIGMEEEQQAASDTHLTVVLPSSKPEPKSIQAEYEVKE